MITVITTLLGASDFDGLLSTTGLVDFDAIAPISDSDQDLTYIIDNLELRGDNATTFAYDCFLQRSGATATQRYTIREETEVGFSLLGCKIAVPKTFQITSTPNVRTVDPWQLLLTSSGKTVDASLLVTFHVGRLSEIT